MIFTPIGMFFYKGNTSLLLRWVGDGQCRKSSSGNTAVMATEFLHQSDFTGQSVWWLDGSG
jgi:hypothetical protein